MALSLVQVTANNVSGNYTPNVTLAGYFELNLSGPTQMQGASGLVLTPQLIIISVTLPPLDDGSGGPCLTWASTWKPWSYAGYEAYGGNYGSFGNCRGRLYTALVGTGFSRITSVAYWDPDI